MQPLTLIAFRLPYPAVRGAPSSQIVEVLRRQPEGGRKHIILPVIDGSCAGNRQHDR